MPVVGCPFLPPIYRALGTVHVQYDPLMLGSSHGSIYPCSIQLLYQVPPDVETDPSRLLEWARVSVQIAHSPVAKKKPRG
jgi:hypothetical protein